jgi:hypothetical protein
LGWQSYGTSDAQASGTESTKRFINDGVDIEDTEVVLLKFLPIGVQGTIF